MDKQLTIEEAKREFEAWIDNHGFMRWELFKPAATTKAAEIFARVRQEEPDWDRLREWAADPRKKVPQLAFTAGPEREIADLVCSMLVATEPNQTLATIREIAMQHTSSPAFARDDHSQNCKWCKVLALTDGVEQPAPEMIVGKGQLVLQEQAGRYVFRKQGCDGKGETCTKLAGDSFSGGYEYLRYDFPPRKPAFVAPPKPEFRTVLLRHKVTGEYRWESIKAELPIPNHLEELDPTTGEPIGERE